MQQESAYDLMATSVQNYLHSGHFCVSGAVV